MVINGRTRRRWTIVIVDITAETIANFENAYAEPFAKDVDAIYTKIYGWIAVTALSGTSVVNSKAIKAYSVYTKAEFASFEDILDFEEEVVDAIEDACGEPFTHESYFPTV